MHVREKVGSSIFINIISKIRYSQLFWIMTFSFLTFLSAQVFIPTQPVPFTLQTMMVLLAGAFLGPRNGVYSMLIYLCAGIFGLPVFAQYSFGIGILFGPTGGYLLSFPFAAFLIGYIIEKKKDTSILLLAFFLGQLLILLAGAGYLSLFLNGNIGKALFRGALIFSIWDLIKTAAAFSIYKAVSKKYPQLP